MCTAAEQGGAAIIGGLLVACMIGSWIIAAGFKNYHDSKKRKAHGELQRETDESGSAG